MTRKAIQKMAARTTANRIVSVSTKMNFHTMSKPVALRQVVSAGNVRNFSNLPYHVKLEMPNLSPTMEKGNISTWTKKVGDKVMPGEALCGIETDKAVIDYEMQEEGYVAKILYADGAKDIALGECIAILVEEEADVAAFANYTGEAAPVQAAPAQAAPAKAAAPAKSYPDHIILEMPNLSPTMEKGNISTWTKKVGDKVMPGEALR